MSLLLKETTHSICSQPRKDCIVIIASFRGKWKENCNGK
nr:MAG TPA: hypothetical protein [Caudoviricetes sp.]